MVADQFLHLGKGHPYLAAATPRQVVAQRAISRSVRHLVLQPRLPSHAYAAQFGAAAQLDGERLELFLAAADLAVLAGERRSPSWDAGDRAAVSPVATRYVALGVPPVLIT